MPLAYLPGSDKRSYFGEFGVDTSGDSSSSRGLDGSVRN